MISEIEFRELNNEEIIDVFRSRIYDDFPVDEIKKPECIKVMLEDGCYRGFGFFENGVLISYMFLLIVEGNILLDYIAVAADKRNLGLGAKMLKEISSVFSDENTVLLEVEDPDEACNPEEENIRRRRINFYLRNNAVMTGLKSRILSVDYNIMIYLNTRRSPEEIRNMYEVIYEYLGILLKRFRPDDFLLYKDCFGIKN